MKNSKKNHDEVNYWEALADNMTALLLMILLIVVLLTLYLMKIPDKNYVDEEYGDSYATHQGVSENDSDNNDVNGSKQNDEDGDRDDDSSGGGDGDGGDASESQKYEDPMPGAGEEVGTDMAAVHVQVVDEETEKTIKESGITFELYSSKGALQVLSTYYPVKKDYNTYQTDKTGTFYLPEKVGVASYSLKSLTTLDGYDVAADTQFSIDQAYDWKSPYVVLVKIAPSKNKICIQVYDKKEGTPLGGESFDIVAAENIVTKDGTTRYTQGKVVGKLKVDENGYGESKELFLGEYVLKQKKVPLYYAKITDEIPVTVFDRSDSQSEEIKEIQQSKTAVEVVLKDALYEAKPIEGAKFILSSEKANGKKETKYTTDEKGKFTITDLNRNTTYNLVQSTSVGKYKADDNKVSFSVDSNGLIQNEDTLNVELKNRMIRVVVGIRDYIFRGEVSDVNIALQDSEGNIVKTWNTTGLENVVEGLEPGKYKVLINGQQKEEQEIEIKDITDIQEFYFNKVTPADIGTVIALILFLAISIAALRFALKARKKRKEEEAEEE